MPKVQDVTQYWNDIAAKAGLDATKAQQVAEALADPELGKVFRDGFKPVPDYSIGLDEVRERTSKELHEKNLDWYNTNKAIFDEAQKIVNAVKGSNDPPPAQNQQATAGLTREQVLEMAEKIAESRMAVAADYAEIREEHLLNFGKPLDRKAFEAFYGQNPELKNLPARELYQKFVGPDLAKKQEIEVEKRIAAAREEGRRDGLSSRGLPTDSGPKEFSPLFDKKADVLGMTPQEQERHSREAFMKGYFGQDKTA